MAATRASAATGAGAAAGAGPTGLTWAEAVRRLEADGPNALPAPRPPGIPARMAAQLRDPLMLVLLGAGMLTAATGDVADTVVILLVVVTNSAVGVAQELRADRALAALHAMSAPRARVLRDGEQTSIPAEDIARGDVLLLEAGDLVPADAEVRDGPGVQVDESMLTGESVPVDRAGGDPVLAGTVVTRGRAVAEVSATGTRSALGKIAGLLGPGRAGPTPLQRRLMALGRTLGAVAAGLAALVAVLGVLRGQPVELMVVTAVSLIVAAVPESLPAVITLSLALGARRMAARRALIRRLPAVESLGSVTVIATDKTGTLTEGRMVAERVWTPRGEVEVSGRGYAPTGAITPVSEEAGEDRGLRRAIEDLARAGVLCNDAHLLPPEDGKDAWEALGDPTEAALLALAARAGLDRDHEVAWHPRLAEIGFDARTRRMSTLHVAPGGGRLAITKGAPDVLLVPEVCADSPAVLAAARAWAEHRSARGYRVLAVASVELPGGHADEDAGSVPESGLHLLGLVAMADPPRESARQTLTRCRQSGIRPVLITGDHPATAQAIAGRLGMVESADIHARVAPEGKLDIVRRLQAGGDVVAMTGDGVNDGPALRAADVGVAMGRRGTEVARQAADVVLADDELATIVDAVEEGRRVYANVRRFLGYGLAGGVGEIVVMLAGPFLGMAVPLRPAQILWVNLLTHGLPGVALGAEPAEPDAMRRGPRPPERSVLGDGLWQRVLRLGLLVGAISLGLAAWRHGTLGWAGDDAEAAAAQTTVFLTLGCAQFGIALGSRALHGLSGWRTNPFLLVSVAGAFALQVAGAYLPILQDLLGTTSPSVTDLWLALAALPVGYAAIRLDRAVFGGR